MCVYAVYIYILNRNNFFVNVFANDESATYAMESKVYDGAKLKMLYNDMQRNKNTGMICSKF